MSADREIEITRWRGMSLTDQIIEWRDRAIEAEAERDRARELLAEACNSLDLMRRPGAAWDDCMRRVAAARTFLASVAAEGSNE